MWREVLWTPWDQPGLEHLRLNADTNGVLADGLVIGLDAGSPFRLRYVVRCDGAWRVREVRVEVLDGGESLLHLLANGTGAWHTADGIPVPALAGCVDMDLSATPFTNTLPIRRMTWSVDEPVELMVAYVELPSLRVSLDPQRYTYLGEHRANRRFRFESLPSGFTADLTVDQDGLVVDYPGLFRRIWRAGEVETELLP